MSIKILNDCKIALFTVDVSHLHFKLFERGWKAILGNLTVSARNCLPSTLKYIVMAMRKDNCEKAYLLEINKKNSSNNK